MILFFIIISFLCTNLTTLNAITTSNATTLHHYLWANYHAFNEQQEKAQDWFNTLMADHSSIYTSKGYISFLFNKGDFQHVVNVVKNTQESIKNDKEVQKMFANAYLQLGNSTQANTHYLSLYKEYPDDIEIAFYSASAYLQQQELENALQIITNILAKKADQPSTFAFHFLQSQIMFKLNKVTEAQQAIEKAVQLNPAFDKGWLLFSVLAEQKGNLPQAIAGYNTYLQVSNEPRQEIQQHLLQLVLKQKMACPKGSPLISSKNHFQKALLLFKNNQYVAALDQINECLKQSPGNTEQILIKVQLLTILGKIPEAITLIKEQIAHVPHDQLWYKVLYVLGNFAPVTTIIDSFEDMHKKHRTYLWAPLYLTDLLLQAKEWERAQQIISWLQSMVDIPELQTTLTFYNALAQHEQKKFDDMITNLQALLQKTPDHVPTLNLLAYYYATAGKNYPKAQDLIVQARIIEPNNAAILDTHGVLLYKQKKYTEAEQLLAQAQLLDSHNATILIHRAKVALRTNNLETAYEFAHKAQEYTKDPYEHTSIKKILAQSTPRPS